MFLSKQNFQSYWDRKKMTEKTIQGDDNDDDCSRIELLNATGSI